MNTPSILSIFFTVFVKIHFTEGFQIHFKKNHWGLHLEVGCSSDLKQPLISHLMFQNNWKERWNYFNFFSFSYNLPFVIVSEVKYFCLTKLSHHWSMSNDWPLIQGLGSMSSAVRYFLWTLYLQRWKNLVHVQILHHNCTKHPFQGYRILIKKIFCVKVILLKKIMETQSQFLIDSQSNTCNLNNWLHNVFFFK